MRFNLLRGRHLCVLRGGPGGGGSGGVSSSRSISDWMTMMKTTKMLLRSSSSTASASPSISPFILLHHQFINRYSYSVSPAVGAFLPSSRTMMTIRDSQMQRQHEQTTLAPPKPTTTNFPWNHYQYRAFSTSNHSNGGRSMWTAMSGSLLSHTNGSHAIRSLSTTTTTTTITGSMIRPFIGTWILQPSRCQYEFGDPPISGTYTIEAVTELSDDEEDDDDDVNDPKTATTHELRFVLEWKERGEILPPTAATATTDHEKIIQTEITEVMDGRWHTYYGSGAPNEFAIDEVSLGLEMSVSSGGDRDGIDDDGERTILVSYGRRGGKLVTSTERQIDFSQNQLIVRQSYYVDEESEEERESEETPKKKRKKFTNVSFFLRA